MITSFAIKAMQEEVRYVNDINKALSIFKQDLEKIGGTLVDKVTISSTGESLLVEALIQFSASSLHECLVQQGLQVRDTP
jgi:wyosine [tRNA(Phe)-imidazoG37] synthetase (radical SAM superfamily)